MRRFSPLKLLLSSIALCPTAYAITAMSAQAQYAAEVSFDGFHDELSHYGSWLYSDRWGMVWQPGDVPDDFRPYYSGGHWAFTEDYGWYWISDYPWGDIAFHYGRWVADPDDGWLWVPGYTWSPGWVVWRSNPSYVGWMPMPPDPYFLDRCSGSSFEFSYSGGGEHISFGWSDPTFGYRHWYGPDYDDRRFAANWVFVGPGHMADHDYRPVIVHDPARVVTIIHQTQNITNYTVVNNYVVNKSVDVRVVERDRGRPVEIMRARDVSRRPAMIATVDAGQRARIAARDFAPIGSGIANSAPPPPPRVVERLSSQPAMFRGHPPAHLFTRASVAEPAVLARFHGPAIPASHGMPDHMSAGRPDIHPPQAQPEKRDEHLVRPDAEPRRPAMQREELTPPQRQEPRHEDTNHPPREEFRPPQHEAPRPLAGSEHRPEAAHTAPKPEAHHPPEHHEKEHEERPKEKEHRPE